MVRFVILAQVVDHLHSSQVSSMIAGYRDLRDRKGETDNLGFPTRALKPLTFIALPLRSFVGREVGVPPILFSSSFFSLFPTQTISTWRDMLATQDLASAAARPYFRRLTYALRRSLARILVPTLKF